MYIHPSPETAGAFFANPPEGTLFMLNLLNFRDVADYSQHPDIAPSEPISGMDAYRLYQQSITSILADAGAQILFEGKGGNWVIGPEAAGWDYVLIVRWPSASALMRVGQSPEYQAIEGHRTAALKDSRLLPITNTVRQPG